MTAYVLVGGRLGRLHCRVLARPVRCGKHAPFGLIRTALWQASGPCSSHSSSHKATLLHPVPTQTRHACWSPPQPVPYLHLALALQAMDATTKRLIIQGVLTNMFRSVYQTVAGGRCGCDSESWMIGRAMQAAWWWVGTVFRAWPNKQVHDGFSMGSIQHTVPAAQGFGPRTSTVVQHSFRALLQLEFRFADVVCA